MHDGGALYDMMPPAANAMRKAGQWNHATIAAKGSKIKFVINGQKVIDADLDRWTEAHKNPDGTPNKFSKPFKDCPATRLYLPPRPRCARLVPKHLHQEARRSGTGCHK